MKKVYLLLVFAIGGLIACQQNGNELAVTDSSDQIIIGKKDSVYSNILDESREIWVHVPESAQGGLFEKASYPVLYLLDGPGHFYSVTGMIKQLSTTNGNMVVPEMIVVAIPNTNRSRDLTPTYVAIDSFSGDSIQYDSGGGDQFLDFIEKELVPYIEKNYPVAPYRTFVGHSFGGLSVLNALMSRPHLFNNYIAIDPSLWWDNQAFMNKADSILTTQKFEGKSLYIGVANTKPKEMTIEALKNDTTRSTLHMRSNLQFANSLASKSENLLRFAWKYYDNDTHASAPLITEYDAFRFIFPWYAFDEFNKVIEPNATADELIPIITNHYEAVSDNFGFKMRPPEELVNRIGYQMMGSEKFDVAHAFFDLNIQNYPNTSNVYDSKGDCYLAQKDSLKALEYFVKALEVGPNNYSQEKINRLKENLKIN